MWYWNIKSFNSKVAHNKKAGETEEEKQYHDHLIIDTNPPKLYYELTSGCGVAKHRTVLL